MQPSEHRVLLAQSTAGGNGRRSLPIEIARALGLRAWADAVIG
jgi:hypothetical protein